MKSYILDLVGYQTLNRETQFFDDPVIEIRSLDPRFVITINIKHDLGGTIVDTIEVFPENEIQDEYIRKYIELRKGKIVAYQFENEEEKYKYFDYSKARNIGHILFFALSAARSSHPELSTISKGGFRFEKRPTNSSEYDDEEFINI